MDNGHQWIDSSSDKVDDDSELLKPEKYWISKKYEYELRNYFALDYIYNGVDKNISRIINTCISSKDAWETLEVLIRELPKFVCQDFNSLPRNLKT